MRSENGFTLIELTLAMVIVAFLAVGLLSTTFQTFTITTQDTAWATAVRQAQDLGYWISQDTQSAYPDSLVTVVPGAPSEGVAFITLSWDNWETRDEYVARYLWAAGANGLFRIEREAEKTFSVDGVPQTTTQTTYIADNVVDGTELASAGSAWELTVVTKAGLQDQPKTLTTHYTIDPRSNAPTEPPP